MGRHYIFGSKNAFFVKKTKDFLNNHKFTNYENTYGVIYIVRDPRNVVISYANHNQITIEQAAEAIKSFKVLLSYKFDV